MKHFFIIIVITLLIVPVTGYSQYFSTGQEPAKIKWRQINTEHFQLIYPEEYEQKAQQLAYVFEKTYDYGYQTLGHSPRKISVMLHTHTVQSNGLVAWAPKRMELFTTPHQKIYAQDWLEELAIHEFRHVVQMDKIQDELPALLPILFGEQAAAAVVGAYLPFWFIEGDAVVAETALSNSGRGRLASFLMENKAQVVENGLYSYNKASLGSFKDFVPNRYKFGYWMVGGTRKKYGSNVWSKVLSEIAQKPLSISPVNRILKQETGFNQRGLYQDLFLDYQEKWNEEINSLTQTTSTFITKASKFYSNYTQAFPANDSTIIALKRDRSDLTRIVEISSDKEKTIFTPGSIFQESFSGRENMLIWSERRPNVRWTHADRSVIVIYNQTTEVKKVFSIENKLFSPTLSPDLTRFAAVEVDKTNHYFLSIFNLKTGERLKQFQLPQNQFIFTPCWDDRGQMLYFVSLSSKGKSLTSISIDNGQFETLLNGGFHEIRSPYYYDGKVYFTGSFTGIDNIYSFNLRSNETKQLSSVRFGADYPAIIGSQLLFSNYSSGGYQLAVLSSNSFLNKPFDEIQLKKYELANTLAEQEKQVIDFSGKEEASYNTKPYRKAAHLFNFHSWAPAYVDVNDYDIEPGISLFSQNKLGTAETRLGYEYNLQEETGKYIAGFTYSGFFPVLDAEFNYGKRKSQYFQIKNTVDQAGNVVDSDTTIQQFSWNQLRFDGGISFPLHFSQGQFSQYIRPQVEYSYQRISHTNTTPPEFPSGFYHSIAYQLYLQNSTGLAELDLAPRFAQTLELTLRNGLKSKSEIGTLSAIQSNLFFPGICRNHGIKLYNGFQTNEQGSSFANHVRFPRGYSSFQNTKMYSMGIDYIMPLLYPDLSVGKFIYLKRLRTSLFYDFANVRGNSYSAEGEYIGSFSRDMNSVGIDLLGDGHLLRIVTPVTVGIRNAYHPKEQSFYFQFLFSVNFDSL
jgi:hypothetical protein